jgi:hypothetical protein
MAEAIESPAGEYCLVEDSPGEAMIAWAGEIPLLMGYEREAHIAAMHALAAYYLRGPQRRGVRFLVESALDECGEPTDARSAPVSANSAATQAIAPRVAKRRGVSGQISPADLLAHIEASGGQVLAGSDHRGHTKVRGANGVLDWVNIGHRGTTLGAGLANQLLRRLGAQQRHSP